MSRFYRELHDRELLAQAEAIVQEVQERKLLEVVLPAEVKNKGEDNNVFPRRLASVTVENGRLRLLVEQPFFRTAAIGY